MDALMPLASFCPPKFPGGTAHGDALLSCNPQTILMARRRFRQAATSLRHRYGDALVYEQHPVPATKGSADAREN